LISTFPGQPLDSKYAGNTVDICPVGALLNRDFRFQSRVWFVNKSPAICTGCANGCNVYVEHRANLIYRLLPRRNEEVNQVWMCDDGRLTYHATNENRIEWAHTGRGENAASTGPRLAIERAGELLRPLAGQGSVGISISAQCTNEEATAAFILGAQLRATRYFVSGLPPGDSDDFLIRADKNPNTAGVRLVAQAFGVTMEDAAAIDGVKALVAMRTDGLAAEKLARMEVFVAIAQNEDAASAEADVTFPCQSVYEQEGTLINWYGRLQRTWDSLPAPRGDSAPGWSWAKRILDALGGVGPTSAADAFRALAEKSQHLSGLALERLPEDGIVLEALLPAQWPARAPRPAPGAHSVRGPQTTPPGMKVGDEASGGSR
jgi:NADH-quinone oxidoreductase subunit G